MAARGCEHLVGLGEDQAKIGRNATTAVGGEPKSVAATLQEAPY